MKRISKIKNLLFNVLSCYNWLLFAVCLYGKFTDNYTLMEAAIIAISLPIITYTVYSVYKNFTRLFRAIRRENNRSRRKNVSYVRPLREVA